MQIKVGILDSPLIPTQCKMLCVPKHKYMDVDLSLKIDNCNIHFATLDLDDGTHGDKEQQFKALSIFGKQIAEAWNEKYGHLEINDI